MSGIEDTGAARARSGGAARSRLPGVVYLFGLTIFMLTTSEFMVAGMLPSLASALDATVGEIGYLISIYALGMAVGGPLVMALLMHFKAPNKPALLALLVIYVAGAVLAALAPNYAVMATARLVTGASSSACFGVSLAIAADLVTPQARGRAASIVFSGIMLAPVLGLPATTAIAQEFGWRASFWAIAVLSLVCTVLVAALAPKPKSRAEFGLDDELKALKRGRLWAAYATSGLIIGATFSAFSYAAPIFTELAGLAPAIIPFLLGAYGIANVVGNLVVGRYADEYTIPILVAGLVALAAALTALAVFAGTAIIAVVAFLAIGLVGVPMNPALVARVMRTAHPGPLINTVHTSIITTGIAFGAWAGGLGIDAGYGLRAPLWIGLTLALLGLLSLAPKQVRR